MRRLLPLLLLALAGCDDDSGRRDDGDETGLRFPDCLPGVYAGSDDGECPPPSPPPESEPAPEPNCRPGLEAFSSSVGARFDAWCGACHGSTPMYGAPFPLTEPWFIVYSNVDGVPRAELVADALRRGTMPPPGAPQPDAADRAAMLAWVTCGEDDAPPDGPNPGGFDVDRPILTAPAEPPEGTDFFELRADGFAMPAGEHDRYQCFTFAAPTDRPRVIRRVETRVDDARVVHHVVLIPGDGGRRPGESGTCRDPNPLSLIYGWAPGQGPLHFADGGMHLAPGERLTLQIHYNNAAGHADVRDESGVRIYHGPVEPTAPAVGLITFGPISFAIAPRSTAEVVGHCLLPQDTTLIASFPHMHETGVGFEQVVLRADGTEEPIIRIGGWDFDSQYIYETPVALRAGDTVITRCRYRNLGDDFVYSGTASTNEMCFNFAYATPPLPAAYCNRGALRPPAPYTPGACAPPAATAGIERVGGRLALGAPPTLTGGPPPRGRYRLDGYTVVLPSADLGRVYVAPELSQTSAAGQVWVDDDRLVVDLLVNVHLTGGYTVIEQDVALSIEGAVRSLDLSGAMTLDLDCGATGEAVVGYETAPDGRLRLTLAPDGLGLPVTFDLELVPVGP